MKIISFKNIGFMTAIIMTSCAPMSERAPYETEIQSKNSFSTHVTSSKSDLEKLSPLIGEWHPNLSSMNEEGKDWMKANNISDYYVRFSWGTQKSWINFDDFQVKDGNVRHTGKGFIGYDADTQQIRFLEQGAEGAFVTGSLTRSEPGIFERRIQVFRDEQETRNRVDVITLDQDNPNCFTWAVTYYMDTETFSPPPDKMCKAT